MGQHIFSNFLLPNIKKKKDFQIKVKISGPFKEDTI